MTNNHIHLFALLPYKKLLNLIKQLDNELYQKIYILQTDAGQGLRFLYKGTICLFNENGQGITYDDPTQLSDWKKLADYTDDEYQSYVRTLILKPDTPSPFIEFEKIESKVRIFVRHYKVYYYLWMATLYVNQRRNIFYINVRAKPGAINLDVKKGQRLFISAKSFISEADFNKKMAQLAKGDLNIRPSSYKFIYKQYLRTKYETDILLKAVTDYNAKHSKPEYVASEDLLDPKPNIKFQTLYEKNVDKPIQPQMMVQYIITFPKENINRELHINQDIIAAKVYIYAAIIINQEYGFPIFNGIDLVGNEQITHKLETYIPFINELSYYRRYGINIIPHIGETNEPQDKLTKIEKYILIKGGRRFGHGISLAANSAFVNELEKADIIIYLESCPISNYVLNYYKGDQHPHRNVLDSNKVRLMICSDDNGVFNYSTVKGDYAFIYRNWKPTLPQFKQMIINGLIFIPTMYQDYYYDVLNTLWSHYELDQHGPVLDFNNS